MTTMKTNVPLKEPHKQSSLIKLYGYDELMNNLIVEFSNNATYEYVGVPKTVFEELEAAESIGKYFTSNIKNKYEFLRIS